MGVAELGHGDTTLSGLGIVELMCYKQAKSAPGHNFVGLRLKILVLLLFEAV